MMKTWVGREVASSKMAKGELVGYLGAQFRHQTFHEPNLKIELSAWNWIKYISGNCVFPEKITIPTLQRTDIRNSEAVGVSKPKTWDFRGVGKKLERKKSSAGEVWGSTMQHLIL